MELLKILSRHKYVEISFATSRTYKNLLVSEVFPSYHDNGDTKLAFICKPQKGELSEDQLIAHFILYLHAQYYCMSRSPFDFKLVIVQPVDPWDGKGNQSLFDGMQFKGIDGLILQMDKGQIERFRALHRPGTSVIGIHKNPEDKDRKDVKTFHLSISGGPGEHRTYNITFKRINNVWLPTFWQLGMIT